MVKCQSYSYPQCSNLSKYYSGQSSVVLALVSLEDAGGTAAAMEWAVVESLGEEVLGPTVGVFLFFS